MAPLCPDIEGESGKFSSDTEESKKREKVDTKAMAKQALDKTMAQQDVRDYLEATKTEEQQFDDSQKTVGQQMANMNKNPPIEWIILRIVR